MPYWVTTNVRTTTTAITAEHSSQHIGNITISLGLTIAREDDDTIENLITAPTSPFTVPSTMAATLTPSNT